jgi:branched-subunit amino acid transport protein AzlD
MMVIAVCVMTFTDINGINNDFVKNCGSYLLPAVAAILGIYTLSAVIYRLSEYGVTANKITLLGTNVVMLCHLSYTSYLKIRRRMARNTAYLPVYFAWAFCVVFILPFIFDAAAKMKVSHLLDE